MDVRVDDGGVRAVLPPGTRGVAGVAAPRFAGWRCGGRPVGAYLGPVAAEASGGRR
ncbi:hypothetical protein NRO40_11915 [Streptomyces changanensis]|uniref:Uncharacterized protein n=1 Tax=Streptomyces changanensis TaxID=2964669 RepID=A0ABY5N5B7_9ACTN|nr:hypothetical protein [Streptomyces changanensis]UUS31469.1 hypothetical protein NRO40_11915 [Streptomyces changanensis]